MLKPTFVKSLLLVCALVFMAATAQAEVVYNRGNSGDPNTLDTHKTSTVQESHIMRDIYEGLTQYDQYGNAIPGTAESWTTSSDGLVYTFKLRQDATWSNGDPVTADDFVFAFRRMLNPATAAPYASILYPIKNAEAVNGGKMKLEELGIRAVDKKTLEITLKSPTPYLIEMLTHQSAYPLHQASMEKFGADWVKPGNLVTNGAYIVKDFIPKERVTLVKNPKYYGAKDVKIDVVNYIPTEDRGAALKRFEAGEIDSNDEFPAEQLSYIKSKMPDQVFIGPYLGTYYYAIRTDKAPYNNPKLRRALSLAVDRDYLAGKIWNDAMLPAYSLVPPGIKGYETRYADYKDKSQLDREDEARKIMEDLGYNKDNHLKIELRYNTSEDHKNTAVAMADMYKNIYVDVSLVNADLKTHYDHLLQKGDFDIARATWVADFKDPQTFLNLARTGDGNNYSQYSNPELDAILNKAEVESDPAKRMAELSKAEEIVMRETPVIVLFYQPYHDLAAKKLKGFEPNIMNVHPTKWLWIDGSRS